MDNWYLSYHKEKLMDVQNIDSSNLFSKNSYVFYSEAAEQQMN